MSFDDGHGEHDRLPTEKSWHVGRTWAVVVFGLVAVMNLITAVIDLTAVDGATPGDQILTWLRLAVVVSFVVLAVAELRRRVAVDADGVHVVEMHRRRTYPWADVSEVREGRPTLLGDAYVYLLRHGAEHVELPNSGSRLDLLRRWHAAMSR